MVDIIDSMKFLSNVGISKKHIFGTGNWKFENITGLFMAGTNTFF